MRAVEPRHRRGGKLGQPGNDLDDDETLDFDSLIEEYRIRIRNPIIVKLPGMLFIPAVVQREHILNIPPNT